MTTDNYTDGMELTKESKGGKSDQIHKSYMSTGVPDWFELETNEN